MRQPSARASILIVEDNADLCDALALFLGDLGYPVLQAANGQEALGQLQRAPLPGLILLDLIMPIMNGWVFRSELRRAPALRAIPIAVMSVVMDVQQQAIALGAVACFAKPVDLNELVALAAYYCS